MILVSGANGLVGGVVRSKLLSEGHKVLALTHGREFKISDDGTVALELTNAAHYDKLANYYDTFHTVIHLAGSISIELGVGTKIEDAPIAIAQNFSDVYHNNIVGTARLLEFSLRSKVKHFIFASSQTVYGYPATTFVTEDSPTHPLEHYALSKVTCEQAAMLWAQAYGKQVTILRFPGVWSERRKSGFIYTACVHGLSRRKIRITTPYPLPFDTLHVDDVADGILAAMKRKGISNRIFNIATGNKNSLYIQACTIASLIPHCVVEDPLVAQPELALVADRAAAELGWRAAPQRDKLENFILNLSVANGACP